jgi:succinoglycan biosynthesis transport protein ExoP
MDFIYLFRILLKRKWIIIGASILAAVIAWVLTINEAYRYRSIAQISTGFTMSDEIRVSSENFSFYEADVKFNNVIVTFKSPAVTNLLSYTLILHDLQNPNPFRPLSPEQKQSWLYKRIDRAKAIEIFENKLETMSVLTSLKPEEKDLLEFLEMYGYDYKTLSLKLDVYRVERTDFIQIDYTSENPELSAFVVNSVFQQFIRYYKNVRTSKSQESIDTLQSLLDKKKQDLDAKDAQLRKEGMVDVGEENASKLETIMNLEGSLREEQSKQTQRNYEIEKINQRLSALGTTTVTPAIQTDNDNDELVILKRSRDEAYQNYVNKGSSDLTLLKKYNTLKTEYQNKVENMKTSKPVTPAENSSEDSKAGLLVKKGDLEVDIKAGAKNIDDIQVRIGELNNNLVKDATKGAIVTSMLKDAELANKEYLAAKQRYNDAIEMNASSVNNFRQILYAQPAIEPEPSKRIIIVGMAGASTLIISILIIILLAYLDSSIKTPIIFSKIVNLKLISMVNYMNLRHKNLAEIVTTRGIESNDEDKKRSNIFRESLRKLRYEIEVSGKKTFLFISTKKGEGKTTLIQALSYSMSMSKKKILIIDTNFCNNDLTVQLHAEPILESIQPNNNGGEGILEQVKNAATDIGVNTVFVIGSEGGDYTPSEILPRKNILHHLQELTAEYDYIFLEGPPLNDFSDSKELAQYVDGVIAIFSANHIIKQIDKQSMTFINELDGKFVGAVLNMVDLKNVNAT